jgi:hypothetical protein
MTNLAGCTGGTSRVGIGNGAVAGTGAARLGVYREHGAVGAFANGKPRRSAAAGDLLLLRAGAGDPVRALAGCARRRCHQRLAANVHQERWTRQR